MCASCTRVDKTLEAQVQLACRLHGGPLDDGAPANQTPVLIDPATESNLVALLCADWVGQSDLGRVVLLDAQDSATGGGGADVNHEDLSLLQLGDLARLGIAIRLHTQQAAEKVVLDLDLHVDAGQLAGVTQDVAHQPVRTGERRVNLCADTDQATGHRDLQRVVLRRQGHDARADRLAHDVATGVLAYDARPDLNLVVRLEDTLQDGATGDATLQIVHFLAGPVHVERANDDHEGVGKEVARRDGDLRAQVLAHDIEVVLKHSTHRDDGRAVGRGSSDKLLDLVILRLGLLFLDQLHLVLEDDDVLQAHDLNRC
mmetsp:Transcript_22571/g.57534  ORF Transcript_22571/g.57534 Transcript_22571/m.57534 type:complete len:315 (+) Transcript_22571:148-1092(+)